MKFKSIIDSTLFSYSQVFFARNRIFAAMILLVTFVDPVIGFCGLISLLLTNLMAYFLGFSKVAITNGDYGFNSMLVGLGLGFYYTPNLPFFIVLVVGALVTLIFTVILIGILYKYQLPYLSVPFLLSLWIILLASRNFEALELSDRGIFKLNELYATGSYWLVDVYKYFRSMAIPDVVRIYFNSLGAILFQFNLVSGIILSIGLLVYSRIAFTMSLVTYFAAYYFYMVLGADIETLSYHYIGFNFILSGIALGSYYLVPSRSSYLWSILMVPAIMVFSAAFGSVFQNLQIGIFSLPFNIVVISFLYFLKLRYDPGQPEEVMIQHHVPERNLYHRLSGKKRFRHFRNIAIAPPVFGKWKVSQAHNGEYTHKGGWREAWDFIITDEHDRQYKNEGRFVEDYYCYDKPVVASADGVVEELANGVDDNLVGDANISQNWGNSIVIKHDRQLYSQLSHLKKDSFQVKKGDTVKKGHVLARCGNSGRSPYPHVHFQVQGTPYIGSKTLGYPLSHYITSQSDSKSFHFFDYPSKGEVVEGIETNNMLYWAFHHIPGQVIQYEVKEANRSYKVRWEVKTDVFNNAFIECEKSKARAWFVNDAKLFYFTHFEGKRETLLYRYFLGAYSVLMAAEPGLVIYYDIPLHLYTNSFLRHFNDFIAPFRSLMRAGYTLSYGKVSKSIGEEVIDLESSTFLAMPGRRTARRTFLLSVSEYRVDRIVIVEGSQIIEAKWERLESL